MTIRRVIRIIVHVAAALALGYAWGELVHLGFPSPWGVPLAVTGGAFIGWWFGRRSVRP